MGPPHDQWPSDHWDSNDTPRSAQPLPGCLVSHAFIPRSTSRPEDASPKVAHFGMVELSASDIFVDASVSSSGLIPDRPDGIEICSPDFEATQMTPTNDIDTMKKILADCAYDQNASIPEVAQKAIALARHLQQRAGGLQTPQERRQQHELERMMATESDKATLIQMTDQAFRTEQARRAAEQIIHILDVQGIPRFFSAIDRMMLKGFQSFGDYLPGVSIPLVKDKMRAETANVILPAEPEILRKHLAERRAHGVRMNVNYLGEALLGERDAQRRLESYLAALQPPDRSHLGKSRDIHKSAIVMPMRSTFG